MQKHSKIPWQKWIRVSTTIDESSQGVNDAADSVGGIVDSINDIEKDAAKNTEIGQKLQNYVEVFRKF